MEPRRVLLPAAVGPSAALWLFRRVSGASPGTDMLAAAARFEANGYPEVGRELRSAYAQLSAAAEQLPKIGSAEVDVSEVGAGSEVASPPARSLTVAEAAGLLGVSDRQVINLIRSGALDAVQRGRGCRWEVDRESVKDCRSLRST